MSAADAPGGADARRAAAFVAVATFAAARDVADAIAARRRGAHPSDVRPLDDVRRDLAATADVCDRAWRYLARRLGGLDEGGSDADALADAVRAARLADALLTAQRLARDLHRLHQHLLGLVALGVPVDASPVEDARHLAAAVASLADADALPTGQRLDAIDTRWRALRTVVGSLGEGAE